MDHLGARWQCSLLLALLLTLGTSLAAFDLQVTQSLLGRRTPWLSRAMLFVSDAHETVRILAATVLLAMWRIYRGDRAAAITLAVVPMGQLLNVGLKHVFQRAAPRGARAAGAPGHLQFPQRACGGLHLVLRRGLCAGVPAREVADLAR